MRWSSGPVEEGVAQVMNQKNLTSALGKSFYNIYFAVKNILLLEHFDYKSYRYGVN